MEQEGQEQEQEGLLLGGIVLNRSGTAFPVTLAMYSKPACVG